MTFHNKLRWLLVAILLLSSCAFGAILDKPLEADQLLLVANSRVQGSVRLAEFYARERAVPEGRILILDLPSGEEVPFDQYAREVVPGIRKFIRDNNLREKVRCIVTFYGVPIRIGKKTLTPQEKQEQVEIRRELNATNRKIDSLVGELETFAKELEPSFAPRTGKTLGDHASRADAAIQAILTRLSQLPGFERDTAMQKLPGLLEQFAGPGMVNQLLADIGAGAPDPAKREMQQQLEAKAMELQDQPYDPDARRAVRQIVSQSLGQFNYARLLEGQAEYLAVNEAERPAVDSELALLWWNLYSRSSWQMNPLHYGVRHARTPPVMLTSRLDGPDEQTVSEMITDCIEAEKQGLEGRIAIDSRGLRPRPGNATEAAFASFDQTLRNLANLVTSKTKLPLTHDDREPVFAPNSVPEVALYCGWYQLRNYVPGMTFKPGAVGYHVASLELLAMHAADDRGWGRGLLSDGIDAFIGPVEEPYLHNFPRPDDFFPLLMTGKFTLAETYWLTIPAASWTMCLIGDPLYRPFAKNPALKIEDLPPKLQVIFAPAEQPAAATAPAGQ